MWTQNNDSLKYKTGKMLPNHLSIFASQKSKENAQLKVGVVL